MITKEYQSYSTRERQFKISQSINFIEKQIKIKNKESFQSLSKLNKFSIENGLGSLDGFYPPNDNKEILSNLGSQVLKQTSPNFSLESG